MVSADTNTDGTTAGGSQRATAVRKVVAFHVSMQCYGIDVADIQEILPLAELSRPPACPPLLAGFVTIGCESIPVIRLSQLFSLPDTAPELYTPMLVLRASRGRLALLVDRVSEIIDVSAGDIAPLDKGHSLNDCVVGVVQSDRFLLLLLDTRQLLLEQERRFIEQLADSERSRLGLLEVVS